MKKLLYNVTIFSIILFCISCEKEDTFEGIIVKEFDLGSCLPPFGNESDEFVITNDSLYQNLLDLSTAICDNYTLPNIDFTSYTLLGKTTVSSGQVKYYKRKVEKHESSMKYIYTIYIKSKKNKKTSISMNWVLVTKLPDNYSVDFKVDKN